MRTKLFAFLVFSIFAVGTLSAQSLKYLNVSIQGGSVTNSVEDKKIGVGGSTALFLQDNLIAKTDRHFWTITARAFNNPIRDGKFISSVLNKKTDAFNYVGLLAGYRLSTGDMQNGLFLEPRVGTALVYGWKPTFLVSPTVGFATRGFEVGAFGDFGFSNENLVMGKDNFVTVGISLGYNFNL